MSMSMYKKNLLFIEKSIPDCGLFINSLKHDNTNYILYDKNNLCNSDDFVELTDKTENIGFVFTYNTYDTYDEKLLENNRTFFDKVIGLARNIEKKIKIEIDFISCNLANVSDWNRYFISKANDNIKIYASNKPIGYENWILETEYFNNKSIETKKNIQEIYFNKNIQKWNHKLDLGSSSAMLIGYAVGNLYMSGDGSFGQLAQSTSLPPDFGIGDNTNRNIFTQVPYFAINSIRVISVSTGYGHVACITDEPLNNLYTWGINSNAELGQGASTSGGSTYPLKPQTDSGSGIDFFQSLRVIGVACGYSHTSCFTTESVDNLYSWGLGTSGQIGNGFFPTTQTTPVKASGFSSTEIVDLACGNFHTICCSSDTSNNVFTWGDNNFGQLGNLLYSTSATPIKPAAFDSSDFFISKKIIAVGACSLGTFCLTNESTNNLYSWGDNAFGTVGNGAFSSGLTIPQQLTTSKKYVAINGGTSHVAAITDESTDNFYVWGRNLSGQLGSGNVGDSSNLNVPTQPIGVSGKKVIGMRLGLDFTLCITDDKVNNIYGCGSNTSGQLGGNLSSINYSSLTQITNTANSTGKNYIATSIDVSDGFIDASGNSLYIVSDAFSRENIELDISEISYTGSDFDTVGLGDVSFPVFELAPSNIQFSNYLYRDVSLNVTPAFGFRVYLSSLVGSSVPVALSNGSDPNGFGAYYTIPDSSTLRFFTRHFSQFTYGNITFDPIIPHSLFMTDFIDTDTSINNVWASGINNYGQLGVGDNTDRSAPVKLDIFSTGVGRHAVGLSHNQRTSACITANFSRNLLMWGDNTYGQLGVGSLDTSSNLPVRINNNKFFNGVAVGNQHVISFTSDPSNNMLAWGQNSSGQVGDGSTLTRTTPVVPTLTGKKVVNVAAGAFHSMCITSESTNNLYVWGNNFSSQVGDNTTIDKLTPTNITSGISGRRVIAMSAGFEHSACITHNSINNLFLWGDNTYGQFGNGTTTLQMTPTNVTTSITNKRILAVSCGAYHTAILTGDVSNNLLVAGLNDRGQLGNGTTDNSSTFTVVGGALAGKKIISVSCCNYYTMCLTDDYLLYVWGYNEEGQLGLGTTTNVLSPTLLNKSFFENVKNIYLANQNFISSELPQEQTKAPPGDYTMELELNNLTVQPGNLTLYRNGRDLSENKLRIDNTNYGYQVSAFIDNSLINPTFTVVKLFPENTFFSEYINFDVSSTRLLRENDFKAYYYTKGGVPTLMSGNPVTDLGAYYTGINQDKFNIFTKHFSELAFGNDYEDGKAISNIIMDISNNLLSWGDNQYGQLGNNTNIDSSTAVMTDTSGIGRVIAVSNDLFHGILLTNDSSNNMFSWGDNQFGQLGIDNTSDTSRNYLTLVNLPNKKVVSVSAGNFHSACLTDDLSNNLYLWGQGYNYQLGNLSQSNLFSPYNLQLGTNLRIISVACGSNFTVCVTNESTNNIWSWGDNISGQLGQGNFGNSGANAFPTKITLSRDILGNNVEPTFIKVACGNSHSIAISTQTGNNIYSTGYNYYGQTGNGDNFTTVNVFKQIDINSKRALDIACGFFHTLFLSDESSDNIYVTGRNNYGQLGLGDNTDRNTFTQLAISGKKFISVGANISTSYALTNETPTQSSNNLYIWGSNINGQLGNGSIDTSSNVPINITGYFSNLSSQIFANFNVPTTSDFTNFDVSNDSNSNLVTIYRSAFDFSDNTLSLFGGGFSGSVFDDNNLGNNKMARYILNPNYTFFSRNISFDLSNNSDRKFDRDSLEAYYYVTYNTPEIIETNDNNNKGVFYNYVDDGNRNTINLNTRHFSEILFGSNFRDGRSIAGLEIRARLDVSNNLLAWGDNNLGQLATGDNAQYLEPIQSQTNLLSRIIAVSMGFNFMTFISHDNSNNIYSCGSNTHGQLGNGTSITDTKFPVQVSLTDKRGVYVSSGNFHAACLTNDTSNNLYLWGLNDFGQLGNGNNIDSNIPINPVLTNRVLQVSCGNHFTVCVTEELSNNVWSWGENTVGQLGDGTSSSTSLPTRIDLDGLKALQVSCGDSHTLCVVDDLSNNLYSWGGNNSGQLGNGTNTNYNFPQQIDTDNKKVVLCSAGFEHSLYLTDEFTNNIYLCGSNTYGQLGQGDLVDRNTFTRLMFDVSGLRIISAAACYSTNIALSSDEELNIYTWGCNIYGQLGNNSTDISSCVPINNISRTLTNITSQIYFNFTEPTLVNYNNFDYNNSGPMGNNTTTYKNIIDKLDNTLDLSIENYTGSVFETKGVGSNNMKYIKVTPESTYFGEYISFDVSYNSGNTDVSNFIVYALEYNGDPTVININEDTSNNTMYYTLDTANNLITIFTKHYTDILLGSENTPEPPPCIIKGTFVLTPSGYKTVETLKDNDYVLTHLGEKVKIVKIFKSKVLPTKKNLPYLIPKNSIRENYPPHDLYVSRRHCICVYANKDIHKNKNVKDKWIIPEMYQDYLERNKIKRKFIIQKQYSEENRLIEYYHILLPNYNTQHLVVNGGCVIESLSEGNECAMILDKQSGYHIRIPFIKPSKKTKVYNLLEMDI